MRRLQSDWGTIDRLTIRGLLVLVVSIRRMRALTCVHTCKSLASSSRTMRLFQAFSNYATALHTSLHRASTLMNSRKRHSRDGFFVTSLKGHSKWIVWERS